LSEELKVCSICTKAKPLSDFYHWFVAGVVTYSAACKACKKLAVKSLKKAKTRIGADVSASPVVRIKQLFPFEAAKNDSQQRL